MPDLGDGYWFAWEQADLPPDAQQHITVYPDSCFILKRRDQPDRYGRGWWIWQEISKAAAQVVMRGLMLQSVRPGGFTYENLNAEGGQLDPVAMPMPGEAAMPMPDAGDDIAFDLDEEPF